MDKNSKIYIAGHNGMVGSAITRNLISGGYTNLIYSPYPPYDLTNQNIVKDFFEKEKPEYVFLAAAKVGGIIANNKYRAQFLYENLMIQNNIIHYSYAYGVKKLLFLGSSCIYPKNCPQPIKEEYLLTEELEYTNEPYAVAKIAGLKMCESYNIQYGTNFISVMPTNLYGPNDNYNLETSHVLPALIRKMHLGKCLEYNDWDSIRSDLKRFPIEGVNEKSKENELLHILKNFGIQRQPVKTSAGNLKNETEVSLTLWGSGTPYREFMYVDDLADACVFIMLNIDFHHLKSINSGLNGMSSEPVKNTHLNIGTGKDLTIKQLADIIKAIVGFRGHLNWDNSKPDGTFRKLLDVSKLNNLGWKERTELPEGISIVYKRYQSY